MVNTYKKGYRVENTLQHLLYSMGYMVLRAPRSGRINLPSPDLIAIKKKRILVLECKASEKSFRIDEDQIQQLREWEKQGAEPYVVWKRSRQDWEFLHIKDVVENDNKISLKFSQEKHKKIDSF